MKIQQNIKLIIWLCHLWRKSKFCCIKFFFNNFIDSISKCLKIEIVYIAETTNTKYKMNIHNFKLNIHNFKLSNKQLKRT